MRKDTLRHIVKCPHCNCDVLDHFTKCHKCGGELTPKFSVLTLTPEQIKRRKILNRVFIVIAVAFAIYSLVIKNL